MRDPRRNSLNSDCSQGPLSNAKSCQHWWGLCTLEPTSGADLHAQVLRWRDIFRGPRGLFCCWRFGTWYLLARYLINIQSCSSCGRLGLLNPLAEDLTSSAHIVTAANELRAPFNVRTHATAATSSCTFHNVTGATAANESPHLLLTRDYSQRTNSVASSTLEKPCSPAAGRRSRRRKSRR